MVKGKKAQGAMEFLMTYGWAIIAVLLTIYGLAYFGVIDASYFVPESCFMFPGIACVDFAVTNDQVSLVVKNSMGNSLSAFSVTIDGCGTGTAIGGLAEGETENIIIPSCTFTGVDSIKKEMTIDYTSNNLAHRRLGKISANVMNIVSVVVPVVVNPGFEVDDATDYGNTGDSTSGNNRANGWIYQGQADYRSSTIVHGGTYSSMFDNVNGVDTYPNTFRQSLIGISPGDYELRFWTYSSTGGRITARIADSDLSTNYVATSSPYSLSNVWAERVLPFTVTPASGIDSVDVYIWISGTIGCSSCDIFVDDVSIVSV